jgi:hypothetical protein
MPDRGKHFVSTATLPVQSRLPHGRLTSRTAFEARADTKQENYPIMKKFSFLSRIPRLAFTAALVLSSAAVITLSQSSASAQGPFTKSVSCDARFFSSVKSYLRAGDTLRESVVRSAPDQPMTAKDKKFTTAIAQLEAANMAGVEKELTFSSVADVRNLIKNVPADIKWIEYNLEGGMSPTSEMNDKAGAIKAFAAVVHASGRKVGFGPTRSGWNDITKKGQLNAVLNVIDRAAVQEQKQSSPATDIKALAAAFNKANPNVKVRMQLWLGQQTTSQMISLFGASQSYIDQGNIGTHGDLSGTITVLKGLGR